MLLHMTVGHCLIEHRKLLGLQALVASLLGLGIARAYLVLGRHFKVVFIQFGRGLGRLDQMVLLEAHLRSHCLRSDIARALILL